MITKEDVEAHLKMVIDPEVGLDIHTMGLIREIDIPDDEHIHIVMTYTTPMCPAGPALQDGIREAMLNLGVEHVTIEVSFDPPWEMPEALKVMMGL
ncbi:MAG: hypothetical protein UV82_C0013G0051 [Candidatus Magasanikbacteria bacterium GW2011_GWD2_43_18]|nr:MAG: hypothetical protein UV18_C0002G0097 [Candidatus Magasanikbacteria bacterium GW2011_GWC2_42_27]KKT03967.1 MAG: hypothetical protein UV82_C0013G0051 [Candidatus Magasanikbacteria bacterium GW2011_GWD2_43_18]KKT25551.1 MAG: hypothetical protein UW10_C0006G0017 [Candidatus Magasanikbacteria bacterium GW2011_GWA2_43_9]HBB37731.1 aromatic ring hydroxylase [Candidatus Magasanikbacteria bacterium]HCC13333.1 aromatic ring hydroxylase [Candidatus Magasanikbacteria bacterium]